MRIPTGLLMLARHTMQGEGEGDAMIATITTHGPGLHTVIARMGKGKE